MMDRPYYYQQIFHLSQQFPLVCLLGARQVGKTTLARAYAAQMAGQYGQVHWFDLENPEDNQILQNPLLALRTRAGLIVIDEIQRQPELFTVLRFLIDSAEVPQQWLILGSASPELLRQTSESLAGRIAYLEVHPFAYSEAQNTQQLWLRGGFPLAYLATTDTTSFEWRRQYVKTFLEQDIPNLGIKISSLNLRRFWLMLAHYHGNIFNAEELSRSLGINNKSIRYYLDILTSTFMMRQLQPWWENISKRQVKSPKIYFRDSGLLHYLLDAENMNILQTHPKLGASWEGFALEQIIRHHHIEAENCFFWQTYHQAELDLLFSLKGKPVGFEFKYSDAPKLTKSMQIAVADLKLERLYVIYPGNKQYWLNDKIQVISLQAYLAGNPIDT